jgi:hypothetical protein
MIAFIPFLLIIQTDLKKVEIESSLKEAIFKFDNIVKPIPAMYTTKYKQSLHILTDNNSTFAGFYTYIINETDHTIYGTISLKDDLSNSQRKSTLVHELIHAFLTQVLDIGIRLVPWLIREGISELAGMSMTDKKIYCNSVTKFVYDRLYSEGGYTEAAVFVDFYRNVEAGLLGMYLFCLKMAVPKMLMCDKDFVECYQQRDELCLHSFEICKKRGVFSRQCNSNYYNCLRVNDLTNGDILRDCKDNRNECKFHLGYSCELILKRRFRVHEFKKFLQKC